MTFNDSINYEFLLNRALRSVVKGALESVDGDYLPGKHSFYISFLTNYIGVKLSSRLIKKYPQEITIVLENQFQDLVVEEDRFSVTLFFSDVKENIVVPYVAITHFADPSADIKLKFTIMEEDTVTKKPIARLKGKSVAELPSNVISLDQFRKNRKK